MLHVVTNSHSTIRHSHFEREFAMEFKRLRFIVGNAKVYKYFLVLITKAQADVMGFVTFEAAQIQFTNYCHLFGGDVGRKLIGNPYYVFSRTFCQTLYFHDNICITIFRNNISSTLFRREYLETHFPKDFFYNIF